MDIPGQTHGTLLESSLARFRHSGIELRVVFRFTITRIPRPLADRAKRIIDDFAIINLGRDFTWDRDYIHYPCNFDSEEKIALWMLVDFHIKDQIADINSILM